ncbi:chromatin-binding transcription coactivator SUB1 [Ascoidea rubescens DSM 1968]|uniref:PC4-domain-containing protein n=1 Tax=Ascoidea rubescens DSM 1968 TaxID=1344418 RepID=A0A1D2V929_9ASCO|nr:PC4-domain-containing protein [Ascoidea rubescens DSM 1968]ODV58154.1 PC4-domain-containing protein [Ascoidea rubescens DSM 1968]
MYYKSKRKPYSNYNSSNSFSAPASAGTAPGAGGQSFDFDLGKRKRINVRQFNSHNLVDIREYYNDKNTDEFKPGKKGISLSEDVWISLLEQQDQITDALEKLSGKKFPRFTGNSFSSKGFLNEENEGSSGDRYHSDDKQLDHPANERKTKKRKIREVKEIADNASSDKTFEKHESDNDHNDSGVESKLNDEEIDGILNNRSDVSEEE